MDYKLQRLERNVELAKAELDEVMQNGYDDITCRSFGMMLNDAQNELAEYQSRAIYRNALSLSANYYSV